MEAPTDGRGTASEETLVYATFDDPAALTDAKEIELVDADGPHPVCIVDGVRYIGRHEVHLGTVLFASKTAFGGDGISSSSSSSNSSSDGGSTSHSTLRTGVTSRVLRFRAAEPPPPAAVPAGKAKRAKRPRAVVTEEDATAEGEAEGAAEGAAEEVVDLAEAEGGPGAAVEAETKEEAEAAVADGDEGPRRIVQEIE